MNNEQEETVAVADSKKRSRDDDNLPLKSDDAEPVETVPRKDDSSEEEDLFAAETPPAKRVKTDLVEHAKNRLSKWAARLFDPDRPRGLIEPPRTIPLNDEFLKAFGKREKSFDDSVGRTLEVTKDVAEESDDEDHEDSGARTSESERGCKVKISNLAYTTSAATLQQKCETFGPMLQVNLIMDKERQGGPVPLNTGRAYVTFQDADSAQACVEHLTELDGRTLRLCIVQDQPKSKRKPPNTTLVRYWERDLSTKCFRCQQVGHTEANCPNAAKPKPCNLCGGLGHEIRSCPVSRVCFKCGVPGHINRDCRYSYNLPRRFLCGICFQSGHHRISCRQRATDAPSFGAVCMVCGETGHYMCKDMKWFFGLDDVSCFNCGSVGHNGYDCTRPSLDQCTRAEEVAVNEIERAEAQSLADELEKQKGRGRSKQRDRRDNDRNRAKSLPAPPVHRRNRDDRTPPYRSNSDQRRGYDVSRNGRGYSDAKYNGGRRR